MKNLKTYITAILLATFFTISCSDDPEEIVTETEQEQEQGEQGQGEQGETIIPKPVFNFDKEKYTLPDNLGENDLNRIHVILGIPSINQNILNNHLGVDVYPDDVVITEMSGQETIFKDELPSDRTCFLSTDLFTEHYVWSGFAFGFNPEGVSQVGETDTHQLFAEKITNVSLSDVNERSSTLISWKVEKGNSCNGCLLVNIDNKVIRTSNWKEENNSITVTSKHELNNTVELDATYTINSDKSGELTYFDRKTKYTWTSDGVITETVLE